MQRLKPVMPSLRERKRYVAYEVLGNAKVGADAAAHAIQQAALRFVGELGVAKMGLIALSEAYNHAKQRGIVRVSHTGVDPLKASLAFITAIDNRPVTVRSLTVSGNITKAKKAIT